MNDRSRPQPHVQNGSAHQRLTPVEFATQFDAAWPTLWCVAAAVLGERTGADDVLQEAALVALGKLDQFDPQSNFMAWMGKIVRFIALNHGRRRIKNVIHTESLSQHNGVPSHRLSHAPVLNGHGQLLSPNDAFDDQVMASLRSLEETARACLLLRTLMDMPYRDISRALDIAEGTAMSHVHRARAAIRKQLSSPSCLQPEHHAATNPSAGARSQGDDYV